ncbi:MAG: hypothetical protein Q9217_006879 [Psora testacea]
MARLQALENARSSYETAITTLPQPEIPVALGDDDESSPILESPSPDADMKEVHFHNNASCYRSASSSPSLESDDCTDDGQILKPSPMRVHQAVLFSDDCTTYSKHKRDHYPPTPPSSPLSKCYTLRAGVPFPKRSASLTYTRWLQNRNIECYNARLQDFAGMLARHVASMDTLIATTKEAQASRHTVRPLASYGDGEEARAADLRDRILRLKAAGWRRERFDAEKYERLCEIALAEL